MENITQLIEEKIERLPIVSIDEESEFQKVIYSDDFNDIFKYCIENFLPDVLKDKAEVYQRISLYLSITNQSDKMVEDMDQVLYKRPVPSIEEFLTNKFYMGYSNATLYNYWKEQLETIFKTGSPIRKVIFSGCIGSGKSTVARKAFVYVLYRILCLRYPRAVFNIDNDATIANIVISMTLKQVYETNLVPFVKLMESMPCFQKVLSQRSFENFNLEDPRCPIPFVCEKSTGTVYFPDNIILTCGSNQGHFTGYNVVNSFCLTGDTIVNTISGDIKIEDLCSRFNKGEEFKAVCYNDDVSNIINVKQTGEVTETIKIWFDNEHFVECTPNHLFAIKNPKKDDEHIQIIHGIPFKEARFLSECDEIEDK